MRAIGQLLQTKPMLKQLFDRMNTAKIRWAVFAGSEVALLTANRTPTDLDIIVHNDDFEKLASLLPAAIRQDNTAFPIKTSDGEALEDIASTLTFTLDGTEIDIMSHSRFETSEGIFPTYLTDLAYHHCLQFEVDDTTVYLANPFDTILIKAFMRRGEEQGKFDQADAEALCAHIDIDASYIAQRIVETGLANGAKQFLQNLKLLKHFT